MRIAYVFDQILPSTGTDTEQVLNTTAAMARAGADVTLVLPASMQGGDPPIEALIDYYQVEAPLKLRRLRSVFPMPARLRPVEKLAHALRASFDRDLRTFDTLYARNFALVAAGTTLGYPVAYETYRPWPRQYMGLSHVFKRVMQRPTCVGGIFHSDYCRQAYLEAGIAEEKLIVVHNGYDPRRFTPPLSREEARAQLGLPSDRPIFTYTGRVNMAKGLGMVLDMAGLNRDALFVIVGSEGEGEVEQRAREHENVRVFGWQTYEQLPPFLFASDVLVLPPSMGPLRKVGNTVLPMKLFLYLAAGRAILAPSAPDTAELLTHDVNAHLVPADDLAAASAAVSALLSDPVRARRLGKRAREQAAELTWDGRARRILAFLERRVG